MSIHSTTNASTALCCNPHWTLFTENDILLLNGGADELYVVDEATNADIRARLLAAWHSNHFADLMSDDHCGAAIRQLCRIGALVPETAVYSPQTLSFFWFGTPQESVQSAFCHQIGRQKEENRLKTTSKPEEAELILLIRSNISWQETLRHYQEMSLRRPHLFIDVAYHHTLSIGPYVVPGDTACVSCLGNRIAHRWGDAPPPTQPSASEQSELIAALILQLVADTPKTLIPYLERTVSLDLPTLKSRDERVFRLPQCPVCHPDNEYNAQGFISLPWIDK